MTYKPFTTPELKEIHSQLREDFATANSHTSGLWREIAPIRSIAVSALLALEEEIRRREAHDLHASGPGAFRMAG